MPTDTDPGMAFVLVQHLAPDQGERAIAVVLSGTGSDGALGIRAIKGEGGMLMVQAPETTDFDGMPRSAISADDPSSITYCYVRQRIDDGPCIWYLYIILHSRRRDMGIIGVLVVVILVVVLVSII